MDLPFPLPLSLSLFVFRVPGNAPGYTKPAGREKSGTWKVPASCTTAPFFLDEARDDAAGAAEAPVPAEPGFFLPSAGRGELGPKALSMTCVSSGGSDKTPSPSSPGRMT